MRRHVRHSAVALVATLLPLVVACSADSDTIAVSWPDAFVEQQDDHAVVCLPAGVADDGDSALLTCQGAPTLDLHGVDLRREAAADDLGSGHYQLGDITLVGDLDLEGRTFDVSELTAGGSDVDVDTVSCAQDRPPDQGAAARFLDRNDQFTGNIFGGSAANGQLEINVVVAQGNDVDALCDDAPVPVVLVPAAFET